MNRLGLQAGEFEALLAEGALKRLNLSLFLTHLACADEPDHPLNPLQNARFSTGVERLNKALGRRVPASLSATGGALLGPDYRHDLLRPGVGLYGGLPFAEAKPVVRLTAPIVQLRQVEAGETVGYGGAWRAEGSREIATLPVGYADGLPRALFGCGQVWLRGLRPIVGRVSMDSITVDVTGAEARLGEAVEVIGPNRSVDALAAEAGTIGYEILTGLGNRLLRRYSWGGAA